MRELFKGFLIRGVDAWLSTPFLFPFQTFNSRKKMTDEELANLIVQPLREGEFKSSEFATLQQLRESFLEQGYELKQFTAGLKYLLDNRIIQRITDTKLRLCVENED